MSTKSASKPVAANGRTLGTVARNRPVPFQMTGCVYGPVTIRTRSYTGDLDDPIPAAEAGSDVTPEPLQASVPAVVWGHAQEDETLRATTVLGGVEINLDVGPRAGDQKAVAAAVIDAIAAAASR